MTAHDPDWEKCEQLLQGYLDRAGIGLEGAAPLERATALSAYVIAPGDARASGIQQLLPWLESNAREITGELKASENPGYRLFVHSP